MRPESSLSDMLDCLDWGVFQLNSQGYLLYANRALLGMLAWDRMPAAVQPATLEGSVLFAPAAWEDYRDMLTAAGRISALETEIVRADGLAVPVLLTAHPCDDGKNRPTCSQGIVVDLTHRRKKEKALQAAHDFMKEKMLGYEGIIADQYPRRQIAKELKKAHDLLDNIIQSSPNVVIVTDLKGRIIIINTVAEETLGYRAIDVIGKMDINRFYPAGMADKIVRQLRSKEHGGQGKLVSYPIIYLNRQGRSIEGNLAAAMIYDDRGGEIGCVHIIVDLSERLAIERQLRQTQKQLMQSEKLAAMGRLTSQIAHELNNPLYGIMNTLELLKTEISTKSKRRKILEMSISETQRLSDLLRKMLSLSKPDQEERRSVNLNMVLEEILLLHEKQFSENSIRIITFLANELAPVYASQNQLRQVFLNMLVNAMDAMPEGGLLKVETATDAGNVLITISDTGTGIRSEHLNKIFDAFFTTKDSVKGVGLGLSVCYGVIKEHNGEITVQSRIDKGTAFTIILPAMGTNDTPV